MQIEVYRTKELGYECDLCSNNIALIAVDFDGYIITICKECFASFKEARPFFMMDVKKDREIKRIEKRKEALK